MKFVSYYPRAMVGNGGPTVAMWAWVRALKSVGQNVQVLYDADLKAVQPLAVSNVSILPLKHRLTGRWRYPINIGNYLSPDTILILHSAFLAGNLIAASIAKRKNSKVIFVPHGAYSHAARNRNYFLKKIWGVVEGRIIKKALAIHVFVADEIPSIQEVASGAPIIVSPTPIEIPSKYKWVGGGGYIGWFGRYDIEVKGLDLLIQAYSSLPAGLRLPLKLHGRDSANTRLEVAQMVSRAGLQNSISVEGPINGLDKIKFLTSAELFVMPSRWDSFGIALLEALSLNVPCLVSNTMSVSRQLELNHACVTSSIDPSKLEKTLEKILKTHRKIFRKIHPRRFVKNNLTLEIVGQNFIQQVKKLYKTK